MFGRDRGGAASTPAARFSVEEEPAVTLGPNKLTQRPLPEPVGAEARGVADAARGFSCSANPSRILWVTHMIARDHNDHVQGAFAIVENRLDDPIEEHQAPTLTSGVARFCVQRSS